MKRPKLRLPGNDLFQSFSWEQKERWWCKTTEKAKSSKRRGWELIKLNFLYFSARPWASLFVIIFHLHECMQKGRNKIQFFWSWLCCMNIFYILNRPFKAKNLNIKAFKKLQIDGNNSFTNLVGGTVSFITHFHGICVGLTFNMQNT